MASRLHSLDHASVTHDVIPDLGSGSAINGCWSALRRSAGGEVVSAFVRIEPLSAQHRASLELFVSGISQRDRVFVDRTLISQVMVASWTQAVPERRLVAVEDDESVSGVVTVAQGVGWSSHTAEVRCVVRSDRRGKGVGGALAAAAIEMARSMGIRKLTVETMAANAGAQAMFLALGRLADRQSSSTVGSADTFARLRQASARRHRDRRLRELVELSV